MFNFVELIEDVYQVRIEEIQAEAENKIAELNNEKRVLNFILSDLTGKITFGQQNQDNQSVSYDLDSILIELSISRHPYLAMSCAVILQNMGFACYFDKRGNLLTIQKNHKKTNLDNLKTVT